MLTSIAAILTKSNLCGAGIPDTLEFIDASPIKKTLDETQPVADTLVGATEKCMVSGLIPRTSQSNANLLLLFSHSDHLRASVQAANPDEEIRTTRLVS